MRLAPFSHALVTAGMALCCGLGGVVYQPAALAGAVPPPAGFANGPSPARLQLGAYAGPAMKNVHGTRAFGRHFRAPVRRVLDFLPQTSWLDMTRIGWVVTPYATGLTPDQQLELSVPLLPDRGGASLAGCAAGDYDAHWRSIATSLVRGGLPDTIVRPGWEMNGTWYKWSAVGRTTEYIGCFRRLVTSMRSVAGQRFTFAFCSGLGLHAMPAEQAYPGDAYVDYISVDLYDQSWAWYPARSGVSPAVAQTRAWNDLKSGNHGLDFWSAFAKAHRKPMGIGEWGLSWRSDGHGGGDNPAFIDRMFDYITDPANGVTSATYFNSPDSPTYKHDIMRADSVFPLASARYRARASAMAAGSLSPLVPASPTSSPVASPVARPSASPAEQPTPLTRLTELRPTGVAGPARVGARLKAVVGRWSPSPTHLSYRWYRDNSPIRGALDSRYRVSKSDVHARLRVKVTARRPGHLPAASWSGASARVR